MPGKIVIVSQYFAPDPTTTATYVTAIANGLTTDSEVLVISGTAHSSAAAAGFRVVEVASWTSQKGALLRRAIAMLWLSAKMFVATLTHVGRDDVVLCVTTPFALPYPVALATRLRKARAVLLIYDLYPEALIMAGLVKPRSLVAKVIRFANSLLFPALTAIITMA